MIDNILIILILIFADICWVSGGLLGLKFLILKIKEKLKNG